MAAGALAGVRLPSQPVSSLISVCSVVSVVVSAAYSGAMLWA